MKLYFSNVLPHRLPQRSLSLRKRASPPALAAVSLVRWLLIIWFMGARLRAQRHAWPFGPFRLQEFVADVLSLLLLYALVQWVV